MPQTKQVIKFIFSVDAPNFHLVTAIFAPDQLEAMKIFMAENTCFSLPKYQPLTIHIVRG